MQTLVRYSGGRLRYTGRITKASFTEWARSTEGRAIVDRLASRIGFAVLGRERTARRRLWRRLIAAARSGEAIAALQREVDAYLARLETLAFANELPRVGVDLHRLVVVPRMFVNGEAFRRIDAALRQQAAFMALEGGEPLRDWFSVSLVDGIAAAVAAARPSVRRPLPAGSSWLAVGVNEQFEWRTPFEGPAWPGHYFVLEQTREPITRAIRKAAAEQIARLDGSLPSLSRAHRQEILRQAGSSLDRLLA